MRNSGIIHKDVDPAMAVHHGSGQCRHIIIATDISLYWHTVKPAGNIPRRIHIDIGNPQRRALFRKPLGYAGPKA